MKKLLLLCVLLSGAACGTNETATTSDGQKKEAGAASVVASTTQAEQIRSYECCEACNSIPRSPNAPLFCRKHLEMISCVLKQKK